MAIKLNKGDRIPNTRLCYLEEVARVNPKSRRSKFVCDCGNTTETNLHWVHFLDITSCGCFKTEKLIEKNTTHGQASRKDKSGAYRSWQALNQRAGVKKNYEHVSVHDSWLGENGFSNFLNGMGPRPKGMSIERKDNAKGYEPSNCKWATRTEQSRNTSQTVNVTIDGVTKCISEWCQHKGILYNLVKQRRQKGMSLVEAIMTPIDVSKQNNRFKPTVVRRYHPDGDLPAVDEHLVFGSNTMGRHGKGAALLALRFFDAIYGVGQGPMGRCYAIPTKGKYFYSLPLDVIKEHVESFKSYAREHPDLKFFVTAVGCGLAGFTHAEIAPFFRDSPLNCSLPSDWRDL